MRHHGFGQRQTGDQQEEIPALYVSRPFKLFLLLTQMTSMTRSMAVIAADEAPAERHTEAERALAEIIFLVRLDSGFVVIGLHQSRCIIPRILCDNFMVTSFVQVQS